MIEIPTDLPAELVPLSWLLGVWEGTGVLDFAIGDDRVSHEFGQRVSFSQDGMPYLNYTASAWLIGAARSPLVAESGYWRLSRTQRAGDPGPGLLPATDAAEYGTADEVETLRNADGGFDLEVTVLHSDGVTELYLGQVKGPRIDLATEAVMRSAGAKDYAAATRLYGLVENHLLWAWDIAAFGQDLRTHASGRLARVD
jgi:hypothetical protein